MTLVYTKDDRARGIAFRILEDNWFEHWAQALNFLSRFTDQEVLDLFIWVAGLPLKDKRVAKIVDHYLIANAGLYEG